MNFLHRSLSIAPLLVVIAACQPSPLRPSSGAPGPAPVNTTFILSGAVTDRDGSPIVGAEVRADGKVVATDAAGFYSVGVLKGATEVAVSRDGYEGDSRRVDVFSDTRRDFVLSTLIRITAGDAATVTLSPNDPSYEFRDFWEECVSPCRIVRFAAPAGLTGTVSITASARDQTRRLTGFYMGGGGLYNPCCTSQFSLSEKVGAGAELVLWVGFSPSPGPGADLRIDFTTSFQAR